MQVNEITEALNNLGNTADEVAAKLMSMNIKGKPINPSCCPIANYLKSLFPEFNGRIIGSGILVNIKGIEFIEVPYPIDSFILRFDNRVYPQLIIMM